MVDFRVKFAGCKSSDFEALFGQNKSHPNLDGFHTCLFFNVYLSEQ